MSILPDRFNSTSAPVIGRVRAVTTNSSDPLAVKGTYEEGYRDGWNAALKDVALELLGSLSEVLKGNQQ